MIVVSFTRPDRQRFAVVLPSSHDDSTAKSFHRSQPVSVRGVRSTRRAVAEELNDVARVYSLGDARAVGAAIAVVF